MRLGDLRFGITNLLMAINLGLMLMGGSWVWPCGLIPLLLNTVVDELAGDDLEGPREDATGFLDAMLVLTLPLIVLNTIVFAHYLTAGDPVGMAALLSRLGVDFNAARAATGPIGLVSMFIGMGMYTGSAMNVSHELVHRTTEPSMALIGRWLSAFTWESAFSLQHMTGHHINAGTYEDPGTARRGETVYAFIARATIGNNISAFRFEAARLARRGLPLWSRHNQFLTGQAMTVLIGAGFALIAGWAGLLGFFLLALQGRFYLEGSAFIEHYGLTRVPGTRFEARHSWNTYRWLSNGLLYNVARHADHHQHAGKPFYKLDVDAGSPVLPAGYMTMMAISLIPPLYRSIMTPRLADWDRRYATPGEIRYLAEKGMPAYGMVAAE